MVKPLPGADVPITSDQPLRAAQVYYEFLQSLLSLSNSTAAAVAALAPVNTSASRLIGNPTGAPAIASEISLGFGLAFSGTTLIAGPVTSLANSLSGDVALNNIANYFDGPSIAQGSTGTWLVSGTVTVIDTGATAAVYCKLWDGTTVIASGAGYSSNLARGVAVSLSGIITSPAGNLRISCRDPDAATGKILFNQTGNSKDSTIVAVRIA